MSQWREQIAFNISTHDKVAQKYNSRHPEIYNQHEQERLSEVIRKLCSEFSDWSSIQVLDYWAGTWNLSRHFLQHWCRVTALDISQKSLDVLQETIWEHEQNLETLWFDGNKVDLPDASFEIIATYSVLHHIPDYVSALNEMCRLVKSGWYVYLEHEANQYKWQPWPELQAYYQEKNKLVRKLKKIFSSREFLELDFWKWVFIRACKNPRYRNEWDIHVFADDHIDRELITELFVGNGFEVYWSEDYLLYDPYVGDTIYQTYASQVSDTRWMIFRKP